MADEQGTELTLQDVVENPQTDETVSQEESKVELTEEQKEELAIQEEAKQHIKEGDPEGFQKRINQVIRQRRTEERERKKAEKTSAEKDSIVEELRKHNEKLYKAIQKQTAAIETSVEAQAEKTTQESANREIGAIQQRIASLKGQRIQARENMDWTKDAMLEDQIDALKEQLLVKRHELSQKVTRPKEKDEAYEQTVINNWINDTPWFAEIIDGEPNPDFNEDMAAYAMGKDRMMTQSPKWAGVPVEKRLAEVRKMTEEHFEKKHGVTKLPSAESGKGLPPPPKEQAMKLTTDEERVVRGLFPNMPFEEAKKAYLEQKNFINGGK